MNSVKELRSAVEQRSLGGLQQVFGSPNVPSDVKHVLEQELRVALTKLIKENPGAKPSVFTSFVDFAISATDKEYASRNLPVVLLSDIFDTSTVDQCEKIFDYVESKTTMWTSAFYFDNCRNHLLRMCNDLLRRLSRTTDTLFCGRILIFLARCLPLMEKSGLNLMSQFNQDNTTQFDDTESIGNLPSPVTRGAEEMEEGEMEENAGVVDFALYEKFWKMQSFFSQPNKCFEKQSWKEFRQQADDVFGVLASWKLDEPPSTPAKRRRDSVATHEETYFAKFLTSQKLLQLQLNDSNFRRYVLIQFLIVFQYLQSDVKFKDKRTSVLSAEQIAWIQTGVARVYTLLDETFPHGQKFSSAVRSILQRESHWSDWKNNGCREYPKLVDMAKMPKFNRRKRLADFDKNSVDLGKPELTRLWGFPDNFDVCKSKDRQFIPILKNFVEKEGVHLPEAGATASSSEQNYQWRVLRLLAAQSPCFFQPSGAIPIMDAPTLARETLKKSLDKDVLESLKEPLSNAPSGKESDEEGEADDDESISDQTLGLLAKLLAPDFDALQKYLVELSVLPPDYVKQQPTGSNETQCLNLLKAWKQKMADNAHAAGFTAILQAADLFNEDVATVLNGIQSTVDG